MPIIRLGNKAALDGAKQVPGHQITTIPIHDEDDLTTRMRTITHPDGLWPRVSSAPAAWVASDDPDLELALATHFACPIGEPDGWMP